jgi:hypothetical protein
MEARATNGKEQTGADDGNRVLFVSLKYPGRRQHLLENRAIKAAGRDRDRSFRGRNRKIIWFCRTLSGALEITRALNGIGLHADVRMI